MAFEPVYETPSPDCYKRLCSGQAVVEARLLPDGGTSIAKVLCITTDCVVSAGEVFTGEARYSGKVNFKALYIDGNGKNACMDYVADFTDKLVCDRLTAAVKPTVSAQILDTDIVSAGENEIKLACVVEVHLDAVINDRLHCLTGGGSTVYTHDDRLDFCRQSAGAVESFVVSGKTENIPVARVLINEPRIVLSSRSAGADCVTLSGTIVDDFCCVGADGQIAGHRLVTPFTQEISVGGAHSDHAVTAFCVLTDSRVTVEKAEGEQGEKAAVCAEYRLTATVKTFTEDVCHPIVDAFSVTNELLVSGESVQICRNKLNDTVIDRVEGTVTLDADMPGADTVAAVCGARLTVSSVKAGRDRLTIEGIAGCNVIYYSSESAGPHSVAVELPFSVTVRADRLTDGDVVSACGCVTGITARIRRGNEIDIKADIAVEYTACAEDVKYVITDIKEGEERALPTGAFAIHIARGGETLWEIAKALSTTPELVLLQNPSLTLPLVGGERVIAYRHLKG